MPRYRPMRDFDRTGNSPPPYAPGPRRARGATESLWLASENPGRSYPSTRDLSSTSSGLPAIDSLLSRRGFNTSSSTRISSPPRSSFPASSGLDSPIDLPRYTRSPDMSRSRLDRIDALSREGRSGSFSSRRFGFGSPPRHTSPTRFSTSSFAPRRSSSLTRSPLRASTPPLRRSSTRLSPPLRTSSPPPYPVSPPPYPVTPRYRAASPPYPSSPGMIPSFSGQSDTPAWRPWVPTADVGRSSRAPPYPSYNSWGDSPVGGASSRYPPRTPPYNVFDVSYADRYDYGGRYY